MNLWRTLLVLSFLLLTVRVATAKIYIYEVVTETRRYQTASKMLPSAYYRYHGGSDTIYQLTVVDTLEGDDLENAAKKYKLNDKNVRELSPKSVPRPNEFRRFIWWR